MYNLDKNHIHRIFDNELLGQLHSPGATAIAHRLHFEAVYQSRHPALYRATPRPLRSSLRVVETSCGLITPSWNSLTSSKLSLTNVPLLSALIAMSSTRTVPRRPDTATNLQNGSLILTLATLGLSWSLRNSMGTLLKRHPNCNFWAFRVSRFSMKQRHHTT